MTSGSNGTPAQAMAAALFESVESDVSSRTMRMTNFPASWVALPEQQMTVKVQTLLQKFGKLEQPPSAVRGPDNQIVATATYKESKSAEKAVSTLHGVDNRTEAEKRKGGYLPPKESDRFAVTLLTQESQQAPGAVPGTEGSGEAYDPEAGTEQNNEGPPALFCVDEVRLSSGAPQSPEDREIYLRDIPLEDYNEQQLREWLRGFGAPEQILFLRDPITKQLTGKGYVRFKTHAEAAGLLAAFPAEEPDDEEDDEPGVQGSWSLSERILSGRAGVLRADIWDGLQDRLEGIAQEANCSRLVLVGGGRVHPLPASVAGCCKGLEALADGHGPMHFVAWPREAADTLREKLAALLSEALTDPVAFSGSFSRAAATLLAANKKSSSGNSAEETAAKPTTPSEPCIVVKGFPDSWREQQVRLVFAVFGGVTSVEFPAPDAHGNRLAHVVLKTAENMPKAVEQLHGTKVGDGELIEECTISCELFGAAHKGRPARRTIFLDELPMLKRPDLKPDNEDREVFMSCLPIQDFSESQLKDWLGGFGTVEEVFLLRDDNRKPNAKGYVRFATHREAEKCILAQASEKDAEEGDVIAWWSESERATRSAYSGLNLHSALASTDGRVLGSVLAPNCEVREVWMQSKLWAPKDPSAPALQGKQVHFVATCTDKQLEALKSCLGAALQAFHEKASGGGADGPREEAQGGSSSSTSRGPTAAPSIAAAAAAAAPSAAGDAKLPAWSTPAAGWRYGGPSEPAPPPGSQGPGTPWQQHGGPPPPPPWGYPGSGPYGQHPAASSVPAWANPGGSESWGGNGAPPPPPGYRPPPPPPHALPPPGAPAPSAAPGVGGEKTRKRKHDRDRSRKRAGKDEDVEKVRAMAFEVTPDPAVQDLIMKGEQLVRSGKEASAQGKPSKAYDKFYGGLQYLMQVMPRLGDGTPAIAAMKARIHSYMDEFEMLKKQKEEQKDATEGGEPVESRIQRGEELMLAAQRLAKRNSLTEAYDKCCAGLKILVEVTPSLREDDPHNSKLRAKISGYLEMAERIKERRDSEPGEQGAHPENGQDPKKSKRRRRRESGSEPPASEQPQQQLPERGQEPFDQQQGSATGIPPPPRARVSSSPEDAPAGDYRDRRGGYRSPDGPHSRSHRRLPSGPGYRSRSRDYQAGSDLPPPPPPAPHRGGGKPSWGGSRSRSRERGGSDRGDRGDRGGAWSRGGGGRPRDRSREGRPYHPRSRSRSRDWNQENNMCRPKTGARAPVLRPKSAAKPY